MISREILDELLGDYFDEHMTITGSALNIIIDRAEELTHLLYSDDGK